MLGKLAYRFLARTEYNSTAALAEQLVDDEEG
jgi:hypothetical protein